ncbi:MAG: hypothetical protein ACRD1H_06780 [Vicinamibacterales bacterium]
MRRSVHVLAATALVLNVAGCDENLRDFAGPTPDLEPTFSSIQRDIFSTADSAGRVACTSCHNAAGASIAAGLNLTGASAYGILVNVPSTGKPSAIRVVPGDPDASYLIQKVEGAPGIVGERMPRTDGPFLTPGQIAIIRRWIERGAAND